jgi:hypothetical protein
MKITSYPKLALLGGLVLLFISLFMEWYAFQVGDINDEIIASWSYNLFFEWTTEFPEGVTVNENLKPRNLNIPIIIDILFVIILVLVAIIVFVGKNDDPYKLRFKGHYSYCFIFLLVLTMFYVVIFPTLYLFPNQLYFPVLTNIDSELNITYFYSIGTGYVLQLFGFVLVFPYSLYYIINTTILERNQHKPEIQIEEVIQNIQETLDLDEIIAEEELIIKKGDYP